jgi:type IV secretion system protein VirB8
VVSPKALLANDVLDRHWAVEYVRSRERYDWNLLQFDYDTVLRYSDEAVARRYAAQFEGANALDKQLGAATELRINIVSVTLPAGDHGKAVVRFERSVVKRESGVPEAALRFIATLAFRYAPSSLTQERDLIENPLGFRVTSYLVDREMVDPALSPVPARPGTRL